MARVILAMSGGVDSSVAASLLKQEGHEVIGVFMRHGEESAEACDLDGHPNPLLPILQGRADHKQGCCSASDAVDARRVADQLDIPFYSLDLQSEFRRIVDYFVDEYQSGRTPNPCVQCNNWIKFGRLFEFADQSDAEYVATGHYAQILETGDPENSLGIYCGVDQHKDQAYVLAGIDRKYLSRMMLPVGRFTKPRIREMATEMGFRVATKKDSQEICFVTSGKHAEFIHQRSGTHSTAGEIITSDGTVVGEHDGIERFTIGQRKGLGVAMGEPHFVTQINASKRQVVIGPKQDLATQSLSATDANWLESPPRLHAVHRSVSADLNDTNDLEVKIRYNSPSQAARVTLGGSTNEFTVEFDDPCFGVSPGQLAVVFRNEAVGKRVLGGGWIASSGIG